ncbi:zinc-binding dehydrogenase [Chroococcidiopsis sp. SAG 2025]|nr:zinc-binding dehydrogenase [Chroococcidiopsis sp. SAG 2025]
MKQIAELIDARKVQTFVEVVLPSQAARQAQERIQTGRTQGKIVLQVA